MTKKNLGALIVLGGAPFGSTPAQRDNLVELAAKAKLPTIYPSRGFVSAGGTSELWPGQHAAELDACRHLHRQDSAGAKPGDLPVQQPTEFELFINLKSPTT
jgi:putative ABC transport system substrate-binding protein